jgi:Restriction endonuclease
MELDLKELSGEEFELLGGSLLEAEGFRDLKRLGWLGESDAGVDWECRDKNGLRLVAETKLFRKNFSSASILRPVVNDLVNGMSLLNAERGVLILPIPISPAIKHLLGSEGRIEIWDHDELVRLLEKHSTVRQRFVELARFRREAEPGTTTEPAAEEERASRLITRLEAVPAGKSGWREYEDICLEILSYAFIPPLRTPRVQSRSEDGLDRRDAVFPIGSGNVFWDSIKYEHSSRMVVVEFKNFAESIGQGEVESLQQYLLPKAKRSFGLLCSRLAPSGSAVKARRRAWMIADNLIVFLSDEELKDIVRTRSGGGDPSLVLDAQIDEFFIHLAP